MATPWGLNTWSNGVWGGGIDVSTSVTGNSLNILSPSTNGWGIDFYGADAWGGIGPQVNVLANAGVQPTGNELLLELGNLTFAGIGNITVTGNQLSLTLDDAAVVADNNIQLTTNLLQALVQSPSISADSFTEAVTGIQLNSTTGSVSFNLDAQFTPTGSEVTIGTTQPIVALPTVVQVGPGPSVTVEVGDPELKLDANFTVGTNILALRSGSITVSANNIIQPNGNELTPAVGTPGFESRYYVTGNDLPTSVGTLGFSTQQRITPTANVLTLGSGSLSITIWQPIIPGDNQSWTPINTGDTQTWTPL